ncbi:uncharacterized protein LOC144121841 [Amblyomma americanum]
MAEVRSCDFPVVRVPDEYFCGDSERKGRALYESGHVHDVAAVWDNPVRIRVKCVAQTSVTKPSYEVELVAVEIALSVEAASKNVTECRSSSATQEDFQKFSAEESLARDKDNPGRAARGASWSGADEGGCPELRLVARNSRRHGEHRENVCGLPAATSAAYPSSPSSVGLAYEAMGPTPLGFCWPVSSPQFFGGGRRPFEVAGGVRDALNLGRFLGLSSSQLLECSSPRVPYLASVVNSSPDATLLLSGLHTVEPFSATNGQPIDNASRSAQFLHGHGPYLQASWLSLSRLNAGTAPVHPAHAWTCAKKAARSGAPFSGLGSTPAMVRANVLRFLVQFLGLSSSQLLECSSPRVPYLASVVNSSPDATLLLSGLHTVEPFSATNGQPIDNASRSAQFLHGHGPYLQASWLSLSRLNAGTAPVHPAHAWTCAKKAARSGAPFSGLGSTPAMARANVLRFLVQASVPDFSLDDGNCSCKAGPGGRCKQVAALVQYINREESASCTSGPGVWGKPSVRSLGTYKKGACLEGFFGKTVEDIEPMTPAVPPPQDATAVSALLDELWDHNCLLVTAIKHELSVTIDKEPVEETFVYGPPVVQFNLRKPGLYCCQATSENSDEDMSYYMANIVQTAEQIAETKKNTRGRKTFCNGKKCGHAASQPAVGHTTYLNQEKSPMYWLSSFCPNGHFGHHLQPMGMPLKKPYSHFLGK